MVLVSVLAVGLVPEIGDILDSIPNCVCPEKNALTAPEFPCTTLEHGGTTPQLLPTGMTQIPLLRAPWVVFQQRRLGGDQPAKQGRR